MSERTNAVRTHRCPRRGCTVVVSVRLFACLADWNALPRPVQDAIRRTSRMNLLSEPRREAIIAARVAWDKIKKEEA